MPILLAVAAVRGAYEGAEPLEPLDLEFLGRAGEELFSTRWSDIFLDPDVQVGPLQMLLLALVMQVGDALGVEPRLPFSILTQTAVVGLTVGLTTLLASDTRFLAVRETAVGLFLVAFGLTWSAYIFGHPEEIFIALLWAAVAVYAIAGRTVVAGVLLGVATGLKLWGVLGLPLLLLQPLHRRSSHGFLAAGLVTLLLYGPFFVGGSVNTFEYSWSIRAGSFLSLIGLSGEFDWDLRLIQGLVVLAAGAVLVLRGRASSQATWLIPLQLIVVRVLLDPRGVQYYWLGAEVLMLVSVAIMWTSISLTWRTCIGLSLYAVVTTYLLHPGIFLAVRVGAVLVLSAAAWTVRDQASPLDESNERTLSSERPGLDGKIA